MATCPTCKAQVPDDARFCQECGTRMTPSQPPQASSAQQPDDMPSGIATPSVPASDPNDPTVLLPITGSLSKDEVQDDPTNQPTVDLPLNEPGEPAKTADDYRTVFLPSISPEELQKQQEWQRLAAGETVQFVKPAADDNSEKIGSSDQQPSTGSPTGTLPGEGSSAEGATILTPPSAPANESATIAMPPSSPREAQPHVPVPPPVVSPPPYAEANPTPYGPPNYAGSLPLGGSAPVQPPASSGSRRQLYWIIGGVGCLLLILLVACALFLLVVIGSNAGGIDGLLAAATVTSTSLATRTARATVVATLPSLAATQPGGSGTVRLSDDFSDPNKSGLSVGEDSETSYAFEEGVYAISVKVPRLLAWSIFNGTYGDATAQVDATLQEGPTDAATALVFRYQDNGNFYVYNVAGDGRYNLEMMQDNSLTTLIDWTPSPAINKRGELNRIRLETRGNTITLYANDTKLEELSDTTFLKGQMALAVNTFNEGEAKVIFDNLLVESD